MFEKNDYLQIIDQVYYEFIDSGDVGSDLSGWEYSPLALSLAVAWESPKAGDLSRYYIDSGHRLRDLKERLIPALGVLETSELNCDDFTLIPSTTSGIAIVLAYLKDEGVERVIVEAPAYYAVMDAANRLGMTCELVAPLELDRDRIVSDIGRLEQLLDRRGVCVWLHQPRYALGNDLRRDQLAALCSRAVDGRFLILDEANDDTVPALAAGLHLTGNVFRLRSLTKALGLNGVRISLLFHPSDARDKIADLMWSVGGSLDWFSISVAESFAAPRMFYADTLRQMRDRLVPQRRLVAACLRGIPVRLLPGETGFLGSLRLDWSALPGAEEEKRWRLIRHMAAHRVPAMLGAHVHMPKRLGLEHIRINFLNTPETLRDGIAAVQSFFSSSVSS